MSSNGEFISNDSPDLMEFLKFFDLSDEEINKTARQAIKAGADKIAQRQKAIISQKSSVLPTLIEVGDIKVSKNGVLSIKIGYPTKAVREHIEGVILEFGRPGTRGSKNKTMVQKRNGKTVHVKIGRIDPYPHIHRGLQEARDEAINATVEVLRSAF